MLLSKVLLCTSLYPFVASNVTFKFYHKTFEHCEIFTTFTGAQVVNTVNSSMETPLHVACMVNNARGVQVCASNHKNHLEMCLQNIFLQLMSLPCDEPSNMHRLAEAEL